MHLFANRYSKVSLGSESTSFVLLNTLFFTFIMQLRMLSREYFFNRSSSKVLASETGN